ncbi:MAG: hypothetical protein H0W77_07025 [Acidobacteria bacterium]|nr:hypothetical protein [Acidobacteriota bacterium]
MSELTRKNIRLKTYSLAFFLVLSSLTSNAFSQVKNSSQAVKTSKGILKIEDDAKTIDNSRIAFKSLSLNKKLVFRYAGSEGEFVSIKKYFPQKNPNLIIFFVGAEAVACIGQFFIVDVSGVKPLMTEKFGNCSNNPRITYRSQALTITYFVHRDEKKADRDYSPKMQITHIAIGK